jgi:AcrR family transcriptional regulator
MARTYTLKARADKQAQTRRRIVDAAVELHGTVGPARTTASMVAQRAGVQRHTYYAHFPDERSLLLACSGAHAEHDPVPDPESWRIIEDPRARLRAGLGELFGWYARNAGVVACVLRDAEHHPPVREIVELRIAPRLAACAAVLGEGLDGDQRLLLQVMMGFPSWRTLAEACGLDQARAVELAAAAIEGGGGTRRRAL